MKLVEAIIKPIKLKEVKIALREIGINEIMESTIISHSRRKGETITCVNLNTYDNS